MAVSSDDIDTLVETICDDPADTWPSVLFEIRLNSSDPENARWARTLWWRIPDDTRPEFLESVVRFCCSGRPRLHRVAGIFQSLAAVGIEDTKTMAAFLRDWMETAKPEDVAELHDRFPEAVEHALSQPYADGEPWAEKIRKLLPPDIERLRWIDAVRAGQLSLFDQPDRDP